MTTALALGHEQQDFLESVRNFCEREKDLSFRDTTQKMAELHWWGLMIDEEYGGSGGTFVDASLFLEEISHGLSPAAGAYGVTLIVVGALNSFGTEEQKQELLGGVAKSGNCLAIAMSEPEAGSDVGALQTRAVRENGEYVLNGSKMWISYAREASHVLIVCRTQQGSTKHEGLSMIFVPRDAQGMTMTPIETLGGDDTNEIYLDNVRVPAENLLGEDGNGWLQLMAGLNKERVILAAQALGLGQRAFDDALAYVKERKQFGRPIGSFQAQQHRFAQLATELTQARLLVRHVAQLTDEDPARMLPKEASMAKLACTELAKKCALEGMQSMGGYGYATEYPMEQYLRAAVVTTIFGGTSEIQKNIIAKTLGL